MNQVRLSLFWLVALLCLAPRALQAQTETPTPEAGAPLPGNGEPSIPQVHTVQEGENPTYIAQTYGVTVAELLAVNNLTEDAILNVGQSLVIPGGQGEAVAALYTVQAGDTLAGIAADFNTTVAALADSNRLVNQHNDLLIGQTLSVVSRTGSALPQPVTGRPHIVAAGESLLMVAARYNLAPMALAAANNLPFPTYLYAGQRLRIPGEAIYRFLSGEWVDVQIRPLPLVQGSSLSIYVENLLDGLPSGQFAGQTLRFAPQGDGFIALVGVDAFTPPGVYTLELSGSGSQPWRPFRQDLPIAPGNYGEQFVTVAEELSPLLEPQVRQEEDAFLATIYGRFSETQQWQGLFQTPITNTFVTAGYGDGRSYNGGPVDIFHTGVDFSGAVGAPVLAPANGVVVFNDVLQLRGTVLIMDHGLGVMSAFFHLSDTFVTVGDTVVTGQPVAAVGSTGLSSGPHLHWDLRIMNIPVNPLQWTQESFP